MPNTDKRRHTADVLFGNTTTVAAASPAVARPAAPVRRDTADVLFGNPSAVTPPVATHPPAATPEK